MYGGELDPEAALPSETGIRTPPTSNLANNVAFRVPGMLEYAEYTEATTHLEYVMYYE